MTMLEMKTRVKDFISHFEEDAKTRDFHSCSTGLTSVESGVSQYDDIYMSEEIPAFPGPLLSAKMQKDELMRFIENKCLECLQDLDNPQTQKSYFFWSILNHICKCNGKVMIVEIALILFKGYKFLRNKLRRVERQEDWCIPLANLLCTNAPRNEHRKAIISMGNQFAARGWTYAAHICYVVAHMELGSRPIFKLIGCDGRLPDRKSDMREAIERTEVYEYALSLNSGFGQADFQEFKYIHACELAKAGFDDQALDYCTVIAKEILRIISCVRSDALKMVIALSENLLGGREEPEWLKKLRQQLEYRELHSSFSDEQSSNFKGTAYLQFDPSEHTEFDLEYTVGEMLGKGGFGHVYAGVRNADGKEVAIKVLLKDIDDQYITIPGETHSLPVEVALLEMVSKAPHCRNVVELLEWFDAPDYFIMILERPIPCMNLYQFCKHNNFCLSELVAREIFWQVVQAACHCCERGVLHRDIKPENILINPETLVVKLIDFGCGDLLKNEIYTSYSGTPGYWPPEWVLYKQYYGIPATVWSLGLLLCFLVCGNFPFNNNDEIVEGYLQLLPDLSDKCRDLITCCLEKDARHRPTFKNIQDHEWFLDTVENTSVNYILVPSQIRKIKSI
ncbi:hypothetical protein HF521_021220 [Silurus meridionalis]|uniref:non-specific serine/threonine protein kinase n=1 Tax=Silurus meridionalis TaxID=175797 RepID=A0A8T0BAK0_SILME|nr:hypothetical protein HF521_021220 [Silurus meridionalis]